MANKKSRGIRGSRIKLEAALAASDLTKKTQTALADAIADHEELDAAPKDLVSKLFRELPVDPQTIERVARILKVDAASLYRSDDVSGFLSKNGQQLPLPNKQKFKKIPLILFAVLVLALGIGFSVKLMAPKNDNMCHDGLVDSGFKTSEKALGIVISRFAGDEWNEAQIMLAHAFASDERLADYIEVYTSCRRIDLMAAKFYKQALTDAREQAARDLKAVGAQLFIWGERYGDRMNIRFASTRSGNAIITLNLNDKTVKTNEIDFALPIQLSADRPFPSSVKRVAFNIMQTVTDVRSELKQKAAQIYRNSTNWLQEAVLADRNLMRSISPIANPRLYIMTGNQLCYRQRLLGDFIGTVDEYKQAEEICRQIISHISSTDYPQEWVSLQINLGSVIARQHIFAETVSKRIETLQRAKNEFEKAALLLNPLMGPDNFTTYHRNLGGIYIRLSELHPGDDGIEYLRKAMTSTETSLKILSPEHGTMDYAQARQNLCVIKFRLGARTKEATTLESGIGDCRAALSLMSPTEEPQDWGMAQNNLAISYAILAEVQKDPEALNIALEEFSLAQNVYTHKKYPAKWAETEINKAELYCKLALMTQTPDFLNQSTAHAEAALEIFNEKGIIRYADYLETLLDKVKSCDRSHIETCKCSD